MLRARWSVLALASLSFVLPVRSGAGTILQDFAADPLAQGWRVFGDTNLFVWDSTNQQLQVTWDSAQPNSYFYHPLGTILARDDDFSFAFDLRLRDIGPGRDPNKIYPLELAVGLLNLGDATRTNFIRGTGVDSPNLVEFDYFFDTGYGATLWPEAVSTNSQFNYNGPQDYALLELTNADLFHVLLVYTAANATLTTTMTCNGAPFGPINSVPLNVSFTDFRVDTFSISSYTDAGDDYDSLLAHGVIDNVSITVPPPPVTIIAGGFTNGAWQVQFANRANWLYTLERTGDFQSWTAVSSRVPGNGTVLALQDSGGTVANAFYRVRAQRP